MHPNAPLSEKKNISANLLEDASCFLLDLQGRKVVTLRLPRNVARELSGQDLIPASGVLSKLKAMLRPDPETRRWLVVTSVDNPLLERLDDFKSLIAGNLSDESDTSVSPSSLSVCACVPINGREQAPEIIKDED